MKKRMFISLASALMLLNSINVSAMDITSHAACVIDAQTGKTYYSYNENEPLAPASMTKVMTVYIVYEKIADGTLSKNTLITADAEDEAASNDSEATNVPLICGTQYSVDELIGAILVPSACAASAMIGKYISGSEQKFALLMNSTASALGINAYYEDASGLSDNNRITAASMAQLAKVLITKYPDVLNYTSLTSINFKGKAYKSTNNMLPGKSYEYPGTDGLKTGTTQLAGCCFTGTAVDDDIRLISVTMHSEYSSARFEDSIQLLSYGFEQAHYMYDNILATDMRLFINGNEVPAFAYSGPGEGLYFIIEDLKDYGFDIAWDPSARTVTAHLNPDKPVTPIPLDIYKGYPAGSIFMPIEKDTALSAGVSLGKTTYTFKHVYSLNGYTAVSADELGSISASCTWDPAAKRLDIIT